MNPTGPTSAKTRRRKVAYGGVFAALAMLVFGLVRLSPLADIALQCLVSAMIAIFVCEFSWIGGLELYLVLTALGFFIPGPPFNLPFACYFGVWPLIKAVIEARSMRRATSNPVLFWQKWLASLVPAAVYAGVIYFFFRTAFTEASARLAARLAEQGGFEAGPWLLVTAALAYLVFFAVYDRALGGLIALYCSDIRSKTGFGRAR